jgi:sirohydrochlorin cobaltochelatase
MVGRKTLIDMKKHALILFAHGARDPKWAAPFERLQQLAQQQLPDTVVSLAFLELMTPRLPELISQLVQTGCNNVTVVPVFLGQGGHVSRDLPAMVDQLKVDYPQLTLTVANAVGEDPAVLNAIARFCIDSVPKP